jgi:isopentenyl-diphosphate delta-isomerase
MTDEVILVDEDDKQIGISEKLEAHQSGGKLHRAISIFIFSPKGEMLLQQRAKSKYHCGGLWTNTCCSHPRPGEETEAAAHRRLKEEMGIDCKLFEIHSFIYKTDFENGLTEHEFDHVLVGTFDGEPTISREEAENWKWETVEAVRNDIREHPEKYTYWFKFSFEEVTKKYQTFLK